MITSALILSLVSQAFPHFLCVDSQAYWDGDYTIEMFCPDLTNQCIAHVYEQNPEGRFLIKECKTSVDEINGYRTYRAEGFLLNLNLNSIKENIFEADAKFIYDDNISMGRYACLAMKSQ